MRVKSDCVTWWIKSINRKKNSLKVKTLNWSSHEMRHSLIQTSISRIQMVDYV